jgi:hypothetical protein
MFAMKKHALILSIVFLLVYSQSFSQKGKELIFGLGGAVTSVWIMNQNFYGEPEVDYAPKMGYAASLNLGYNFTENISAITELQYSSQGQKYEGKQTMDGNKYDVKRDIDLRYFNIPVYFKYAFGTSDVKFRVLAGPQIGILLEATQNYTRDGIKQGDPLYNLDGEEFMPHAGNITDRYENIDIGISADIGADIHFSDLFYVSAGLRGNYGFKDINAPAYRLQDLDQEYSPSQNAWGGIYFSINYKLDVEGYRQRSF